MLDRGQFCPRSDAHSTYGSAPDEASGAILAAALIARASRSIAADVGQQVVFAQKLPERPAILLHGRRGTSDVPVVRMQNRREKVVLESPNDTGFHCSE